jgi:ribonuclease Z
MDLGVAILADSCDSSAMLPMANDADVLVHEATFPASESDGYARTRGHSTTRMAAKFAAKANAKTLILTHFGGLMQALVWYNNHAC